MARTLQEIETMRGTEREVRLVGPVELTVVLPTFNERDNVEPLIERLEEVLAGIAWEAIFVDDDSRDGTAEHVRGIGRRKPNIRCLQRLGRRGLSTACIEGILASSAPFLAVMDADLQHDETLLPRMLAALKSEELDIVIGSVHSHMSQEPEEMTDRLLRALECPHLKALGHPTGRLLLQREPFAFDFDRVVAEAVRRGVWLELNASPERLDLSANHVRAAKAKGARFIISTDAHHPKHLLNMRYGIATARRGGLGTEDVINTLSQESFAKALRP